MGVCFPMVEAAALPLARSVASSLAAPVSESYVLLSGEAVEAFPRGVSAASAAVAISRVMSVPSAIFPFSRMVSIPSVVFPFAGMMSILRVAFSLSGVEPVPLALPALPDQRSAPL